MEQVGKIVWGGQPLASFERQVGFVARALAEALANGRRHLAPDGPFLFDFFSGPAVVASGPSEQRGCGLQCVSPSAMPTLDAPVDDSTWTALAVARAI